MINTKKQSKYNHLPVYIQNAISRKYQKRKRLTAEKFFEELKKNNGDLRDKYWYRVIEPINFCDSGRSHGFHKQEVHFGEGVFEQEVDFQFGRFWKEVHFDKSIFMKSVSLALVHEYNCFNLGESHFIEDFELPFNATGGIEFGESSFYSNIVYDKETYQAKRALLHVLTFKIMHGEFELPIDFANEHNIKKKVWKH